MSAFSIGATLLDAMVLAILSQADTYGYQITKDIQAHFAVSESTLYPVLRRLQKNGSLITYDQPYQGRNRRYYQITPAGGDLLEQYRQDWIIYQEQVNFFLGKPKK
ncbi:PadR family transcriptional regulator [Ruminococcus sp.]